MPNILVRDVDEVLLAKLKVRAKANGRSLQSEVINMFRKSLDGDAMSDKDRAAKIKESLRGRTFSDSAALLREDRGR